MNELEKAVADLVTKATSAAETAGRFAVEQLPDIAQQYVLYKGISSLIWALAFIPVIVGCFVIGRRVHEWCADEGDMFPLAIYMIPGSFVVLGSAALSLKNLQDALLAFIAPKVLLLQWAASLVK